MCSVKLVFSLRRDSIKFFSCFAYVRVNDNDCCHVTDWLEIESLSLLAIQFIVPRGGGLIEEGKEPVEFARSPAVR